MQCKMDKTIKIRECYVDMQFLNPSLWLYKFTMDELQDKELKLTLRSIMRLMNTFLDFDKPMIPISYIPKSQIHLVITGTRILRKYTNLDKLCLDIHDPTEKNKKFQSTAKSIIKELTDDEFRKSDIFLKLNITARGLFKELGDITFSKDEVLQLRHTTELKNSQIQCETVMEPPMEHVTFSKNEVMRLSHTTELKNIQIQCETVMEPPMEHVENDIIDAAITLTRYTNQEVILNKLGQLSLRIAQENCHLVNKKFVAIIKMLLNLMDSEINRVIVASWMTLCKLLKSENMKKSCSNFLDSILLKMIECYKISTELAQTIDSIIPKIAAVLPLDESINILTNVMTARYPSNLCALNVLIALVDLQGKDLTENHLERIIAKVIMLTENSDSVVRKSSVFCIAMIYLAMGDSKVKPKLVSLTPRNLKLFHVYVQKVQQLTSSKENATNIENSSIENNKFESARSVNPECNEVLSQIKNNCNSYDNFVQSTNVMELAAKRLNELNNIQNRSTSKKLTEIIIQNTWNQVQIYAQNPELAKVQVTHNNPTTILRQFTIERMKSQNLEYFDTQTVLSIMTRYANMDKPIVPFTYLMGLRNIFPDLYTFVKYTNVIQLLKQHSGLNIEGAVQIVNEWYNGWLKNTQPSNEIYSRFKINAKYLFLLQYEEARVSHNNEMVEEEIYRNYEVSSSVSHIEAPITDAIETMSVESVQNQSSNVETASIKNMERDKEPYLNTRKLSISGVELVNHLHVIDKLPYATREVPHFTAGILESSDFSQIVDPIQHNISNESTMALSEGLPIDQPHLPYVAKEEPLDESLQNHMSVTSEFSLSADPSQTQRFNERNRYMVVIPIIRTESIPNDSPTNEHSPEILTSKHNQSLNKHNGETFETLLDNFLDNIKSSVDFASLTKSYIKEKFIEKLNSLILPESNVSQSTNHSPISNNGNVDHLELNATEINSDRETSIQVELQTSSSREYDIVEMVSNVPKLIEKENSMTVPQLLVTEDSYTQNNVSQNVNQFQDLLTELRLSDSINTDTGLLQRIDKILGEPNDLNGRVISKNLGLNDLIQHPNVTTIRKQGSLKRKLDTANQENEMIGLNVKRADLHGTYLF